MSEKCLIFGSGFGLYGYLPAAYELGYDIFLPTRYRTIFESRVELSKYSNRICWICDDILISEIAWNMDLIIIAKRPTDQVKLLNELYGFDKVYSQSFGGSASIINHNQNIAKKSCRLRNLILEKPIAPNPYEALSLLKCFERNAFNVSFRIGYTFLYTEWGKRIIKQLKSKKKSY